MMPDFFHIRLIFLHNIIIIHLEKEWRINMEERLQKYMARCGVASRRKCEEIILQGRVKVDGIIVSELGVKVNPDINMVTMDSKPIKPEERKVYILLNKPTGYLSAVSDDRGRKTIVDLINSEERIFPIGRLDYDTSGLILLTNDGEVYNKVIHPRVNIDKVYIARVKGKPDGDIIKRFETGIDIGGYVTAPGRMKIIKTENGYSDVEIIIHEGKNRQVRRMCDTVGHPVVKLKRVAIGKITLDKSLATGQWRNLTEKEVKYLMEGCSGDV